MQEATLGRLGSDALNLLVVNNIYMETHSLHAAAHSHKLRDTCMVLNQGHRQFLAKGVFPGRAMHLFLIGFSLPLAPAGLKRSHADLLCYVGALYTCTFHNLLI